MEMFLKWCYKLMFKFDVCFRNIEVINNFFKIRKCLLALLLIWYHTRHILNTKMIKKKLQLTVQKGAVCTHVTSSAASRYSAGK